MQEMIFSLVSRDFCAQSVASLLKSSSSPPVAAFHTGKCGALRPADSHLLDILCGCIVGWVGPESGQASLGCRGLVGYQAEP